MGALSCVLEETVQKGGDSRQVACVFLLPNFRDQANGCLQSSPPLRNGKASEQCVNTLAATLEIQAAHQVRAQTLVLILLRDQINVSFQIMKNTYFKNPV